MEEENKEILARNNEYNQVRHEKEQEKRVRRK
jgi:hypothetical protein